MIKLAPDPRGLPPTKLTDIDEQHIILHVNGEDVHDNVSGHFKTDESRATAKLIELKTALNRATDDEFWPLLVESISDITDSQMTFVSKRVLVDDENTAVELPPIGQEGSCLAGVVFCFNEDNTERQTLRNIRYKAYNCPCAYMSHNKVFIIPEKWNEVIFNNPNELAYTCESYIGVPLFADGKCFAHFGLVYTPAGALRRRLSWNYLEMFFHSLEDLVVARLVRGQGLNIESSNQDNYAAPSKVIPHEAISMSQSMKPYARSLSHELRTPMQGVVGMLDVMYATVQEAVEGYPNGLVNNVFRTLKDNIEVVQDSSRRAVEAADNVVHAYDLNMGVPETPVDEDPSKAELTLGDTAQAPPKFGVFGQAPLKPNAKRERSASPEISLEPPMKYRVLAQGDAVSPDERSMSPRRQVLRQAVRECHDLLDPSKEQTSDAAAHRYASNTPPRDQSLPIIHSDSEGTPQASLRNTRLRELLPYIVHESLRVGGRPDTVFGVDTTNGERIQACFRKSDGGMIVQNIEWSVDPMVPEVLVADERDLGKMITCILLNAIKFTESGDINLSASLSPRNKKYVNIIVKDTGPGIPKDFLPYLFKPFSQEDASITRHKEGLGLGLLVAKGLVRKLGGDLTCIRSDTSGPNHGTEFEIRFPAHVSENGSHPGTPLFRTPTPTGGATIPDIDIPRSSLEPKSLPQPTLAPNTVLVHSPSSSISPEIQPLPTPSPYPPATRRGSYNSKSSFDRNLAKRHPMNFLVVEDNKLNRRLLVNMLSKLGYKTVVEAHDGVEAVKQMERPRSPAADIDLVLMDLWMPNMDGYEATRRILAMPQRKAQPVRILAVSADVTGEALDRAGNVGMSGFMTKPYKLLDLERLIIDAVEQRAMAEAAMAAAAAGGGAAGVAAPAVQTPGELPSSATASSSSSSSVPLMSS